MAVDYYSDFLSFQIILNLKFEISNVEFNISIVKCKTQIFVNLKNAVIIQK